MTFDLGPTAPTTGFPACRDSLRKLLTDASNPGAVRLIAINPTLRAETEELLPVLHERSAPDRDGLLALLVAKVEGMIGAPRCSDPRIHETRRYGGRRARNWTPLGWPVTGEPYSRSPNSGNQPITAKTFSPSGAATVRAAIQNRITTQPRIAAPPP